MADVGGAVGGAKNFRSVKGDVSDSNRQNTNLARSACLAALLVKGGKTTAMGAADRVKVATMLSGFSHQKELVKSEYAQLTRDVKASIKGESDVSPNVERFQSQLSLAVKAMGKAVSKMQTTEAVKDTTYNKLLGAQFARLDAIQGLLEAKQDVGIAHIQFVHDLAHSSPSPSVTKELIQYANLLFQEIGTTALSKDLGLNPEGIQDAISENRFPKIQVNRDVLDIVPYSYEVFKPTVNALKGGPQLVGKVSLEMFTEIASANFNVNLEQVGALKDMITFVSDSILFLDQASQLEMGDSDAREIEELRGLFVGQISFLSEIIVKVADHLIAFHDSVAANDMLQVADLIEVVLGCMTRSGDPSQDANLKTLYHSYDAIATHFYRTEVGMAQLASFQQPLDVFTATARAQVSLVLEGEYVFELHNPMAVIRENAPGAAVKTDSEVVPNRTMRSELQEAKRGLQNVSLSLVPLSMFVDLKNAAHAILGDCSTHVDRKGAVADGGSHLSEDVQFTSEMQPQLDRFKDDLKLMSQRYPAQYEVLCKLSDVCRDVGAVSAPLPFKGGVSQSATLNMRGIASTSLGELR